MGKESLIKSTTKKASPKKAKTSKKTPAKPRSSAKTTKKTGAKDAAQKAGSKTETIAAAASKAGKAPTLKDLLFKKFSDPPVSKAEIAPLPDFSRMTAPPLIDIDDPKEADRLRALLSLKFSMDEIKAVAKPPEERKPAAPAPEPLAAAAPKPATPEPEAPKAEPPSLKDLLFKKFAEPPATSAEASSSPDFSRMTAPPLIDTDDPKEADRLRALLSLKFSMDEIKAVAKPPEERKPAAPTPEPPKAEEPKPAEPKPEPPKTEAPKPAEPKPEPPKTEAPKPAEPKPEPPKAEAPKPAAPKPPEKPKVQEPAPVAAPPQPAPVTPPPKDAPEPRFKDPVLRSAAIGLAVIGALFLTILWASFSNSTKYFIVPKKGSIEIWRGEFSPTGKEFFAVLHGIEPEAPIAEEYSRIEVYPMIFNYFLEKSDALLEVSELPDYKSIIDYLEKAQIYALNPQMREEVTKRLTKIQGLTLLYKADVDAGKGTVESLTSAIDSLKQAQRLTKDPAQVEVLDQKIELLQEHKADLEREIKAKAAAAAAAEAEESKAAPEHQE